LQLKDTVFRQKFTLNCGGRLIDLSQPQVMGIINLTNDSFYAGSRTAQHELLNKAGQMLGAGALMLDLGAYSTRPGASEVNETDEMAALLPAIRLLMQHFPGIILSVDTFRARVAAAAAGEGALLINDVSGGEADTAMFETVAQLGLPYVLMHMRGTPATMQSLTDYSDLLADIMADLTQKLVQLRQLGVKDVIIDPGFGFAKTIDQNFKLLRELEQFNVLDCPLLVGVSRKSMVYKTLHTTAEQALNGTTVLHAWALERGARILRVHDVQPAVEAIQLWNRFETV
jgi:dihydropteroate synthase